MTPPGLAQDLAEDKQGIGNAYNVIVAITVAIQSAVAMFSSYCLMILYSFGSDPALVYRYVAHMHSFFAMLEFGTFLPALGIFTMVSIQAYLNCTGPFGLIAAGAVALIYLVHLVAFAEGVKRAGPCSLLSWFTLVAPWRTFDRRIVADGKRLGKVLMDQAASGVLRGLDPDDAMAIDDEAKGGVEMREKSAEEKDLTSWVATAVPELDGARASKLAAALASQGLTPARLRAFAQLPSANATALISILNFAEISLTQGERLGIAIAVLREAEGVRI